MFLAGRPQFFHANHIYAYHRPQPSSHNRVVVRSKRNETEISQPEELKLVIIFHIYTALGPAQNETAQPRFCRNIFVFGPQQLEILEAAESS